VPLASIISIASIASIVSIASIISIVSIVSIIKVSLRNPLYLSFLTPVIDNLYRPIETICCGYAENQLPLHQKKENRVLTIKTKRL
jgi:hypothetical protein